MCKNVKFKDLYEDQYYLKQMSQSSQWKKYTSKIPVDENYINCIYLTSICKISDLKTFLVPFS